MSKANLASLLILINDGKEHELFELNQKYRMTYSQARNAILTLDKLGVISVNDKQFRLKNNITKTQLKELYKLIGFRELDLERDTIENYKHLALPTNSLYKPNLSRIDKKLRVD
ncbi:hypothetical protein HG263_04665 [Pseudoalteromonas sp. JBTF-M23]|uniref:Uncharacterized protein n=1 Tax=Pseudoalteromonas caenipelagi TaxID=2726988 RepID=A0A849V9C1_9GAMM|nr:hypothetical protein [Pseudoalteromonas caenipelagi]NOU49826.1 hypothetical protein [Pseudoalteromonas caenipelagi]